MGDLCDELGLAVKGALVAQAAPELDDKPVYEKQHVRGGTLSPVVVIDLGAAKKLTLEVEGGPGYVQDRLNWIEPALLREVPKPEAPATQPQPQSAASQPAASQPAASQPAAAASQPANGQK